MVFKNFKRSNSDKKRPVITLPQVPQRQKIEALYDYDAQGDMELNFYKGDQFFLINEADENWYNVTDKDQLKAGVVPKSYFKNVSSALTGGAGANGGGTSAIRKRQSLTTLHGRVLYEFDAMSAQELQVNKDEYVTICAHSGNDWYIAKPVSRLGGPGLVPVSYIGVIDIAVGNGQLKVFTPQDIANSRLPTVEQWNKERDEYKKSATPISGAAAYQSGGSPSNQSENYHYAQQQQHGSPPGAGAGASQHQNYYSDQTSLNRSETLLSSKTSSSFLEQSDIHVIRALITEKYFTKENDGRGKYWYLIELTFDNGVKRLINRCYEDFFEFQAMLKKLFPRDANDQSRRILPTIPGPLANVSATIADQRLNDLNNYLFELLDLPTRISRCKYVLTFFDIKYYNDRNIISENHNQNDVSQQQQQQQQQRPAFQQYPSVASSSHTQTVQDQYPSYQQYQQQQQQQAPGPGQGPGPAQLPKARAPQQQQAPQQHYHTQPQQHQIQQQEQQQQFTSSQHSSSSFSQRGTNGGVSGTEEKFKFYFNDEIFVLKLSKNSTTMQDLKTMLMKRCNADNFQLVLISDIDHEYELNSDDDLWRCFELEPKRRRIRIIPF